MSNFSDDFDEFDHLLEDDDVPARGAVAVAQPRTGRPARAPRAGGSAKPRVTRPTIRITPDWNRVAAVLFVAAVVLFIAWFAVSSIVSARREGAYKDYFGKVRQIATQSTGHGASLDSILNDPNGGDRSQRIASIEALATQADKTVKDAEALDVPEQLQLSHEALVMSLEYRAAGLDAVQRALTASIDSKDQDASAEAVAAAMSRLVASDVVWADSFAVTSRSVLAKDEVDGVTVPDSVFVDDLEALSPKGIGSMLDRLEVSAAANKQGAVEVPKDGKIRGGQLESGQIVVTPSGQTLVPGGLTEIKGGDDITFEVPFTNQGEVQLTEVPVQITLRGDESDPMTLTGVIDTVDPGQTATAKVALNEIPNFGEVLEMDVLVGPIPGEKSADNNRGSYQIQFSL
jgi:hypothetical protein